MTPEREKEIREQLEGRRFGWPQELLFYIDRLKEERLWLREKIAVADAGMEKLGSWMSAALSDDNVCQSMKNDIEEFFKALAKIRGEK